MEEKMIDHLFRHQHGKMVSILTRIFGLSHLETIEDAVQDTFVKALLAWRTKMPDNPEAWLMQAAKNRAIDIFRKLSADQQRHLKIDTGTSAIAFNNLFLENEIEDSQLRMVFTACHPNLNPKDQIAFALKTVSGFSSKEIASALLLKDETIKKRLVRARKSIKEKSISFEIPIGKSLPERLNRVLEVLYLIFNEGFHSNRKDMIIRKDLCGEAMRLCKFLIKNKNTQTPSAYALFALMCFHAARIDSKINEKNEIIDLKNQDRSKWYMPLIVLGNDAMNKAVENNEFTTYHYEAAIAGEHVVTRSFEKTNWEKILGYYEKLYQLQPSPMTLLNMAIIELQRKKLENVNTLLQKINPKELEQRAYLYYGTLAEFFIEKNDKENALLNYDKAISLVKNNSEKDYLTKKRAALMLDNIELN